ncbi:MAG: hypothetical protein HDR17_08495 [Lachnospiraceae bacterium]|nr:hypothetical protein [Lachnospiraceae bacterium]
MTDMIVSGTILICMILILRRLTYGRISMGMRYALWLVVAVRMVLPVSFGSSSFSIMNAVQGISQYYVGTAGAEEIHKNSVDEKNEGNEMGARVAANVRNAKEALQDMSAGIESALTAAGSDVSDMTAGMAGAGADGTGTGVSDMAADMAGAETDGEEMGATLANSSADRQDRQIWYGSRERFYESFRLAVVMIWVMGVIAVGGFALFRQVRFIVYLHRTREQAQTDCLPAVWTKRLADHGIQIWLVKGLPGPCMAGKSIYISPELYEEEEIRLHILAHEYAHAVQGDTLWAAVRSILCTVWWFHPLVWLAAYEAKQDSELACDERAVRLLGETQRFSYGRTLLDLMNVEHARIGANGVVLTMDGSSRRIRQRIVMIAGVGKRSKIITGIVALAVLLLCGCAYTGAETAQEIEAAGHEAAVQEAIQAAEEEQAAIQAAEEEQAAIQAAEAEQIQRRWEELEEMERLATELEKEREAVAKAVDEAEAVQMRQNLEELEAQKAEEETELLQWLEELKAQKTAIEEEEAQVQKELKRIKTEWNQATAREFEDMLWSMTDDALIAAAMVDVTAYYDYLYNGGQFPLEDGAWYLIRKDEEYGIDLYGLYTDQYGCRGVKMMIDGDVNSLDLPWLPTGLKPEIFMLEQTQDGLPRTFAFQMCLENTGSSEIWKLYLVDRYDTGTIDLYAFDEEDYQKQFRDKVSFRVDSKNEKVLLLEDGSAAKGGIDISLYKDYTVEDVFWDGSSVVYSMEDDGHSLNFVTSIGLKLAETDEIQFSRLSLITCPVQIGEWGERSFTLGSPTVDPQHVNGMVQTLHPSGQR